MSPLAVLAYVVDACIIVTYGVLAFTGDARWFHRANAIGCFPLVAVEVSTHAYPVMPLTLFFGALGILGMLRGAPNDCADV